MLKTRTRAEIVARSTRIAYLLSGIEPLEPGQTADLRAELADNAAEIARIDREMEIHE